MLVVTLTMFSIVQAGLPPLISFKLASKLAKIGSLKVCCDKFPGHVLFLQEIHLLLLDISFKGPLDNAIAYEGPFLWMSNSLTCTYWRNTEVRLASNELWLPLFDQELREISVVIWCEISCSCNNLLTEELIGYMGENYHVKVKSE